MWSKIKSAPRGDLVYLLFGVGLIVLMFINLGPVYGVLVLAFVAAFDAVLIAPDRFRDGVNVIAIAAAFVAYFLTIGKSADLRFYVAAAQIVPVLFVAMMIQVRLEMADRKRPSELRRAAGLVTVVLVTAEVESLDALVSGAPANEAFSVVAAGLAAAAVSLVLPVLLGGGGPPDPGDRNSSPRPD